MYKPFSKGRWYRFVIESNGTELTLTSSDIKDAAIVNNALVLPEGYKVMDVVTDINSIANAASDASQGNKIITDDGKQGYLLPDVTTFDHSFIYVFVRRVDGVIYTPSQDEGTIPDDSQEPKEGPIDDRDDRW